MTFYIKDLKKLLKIFQNIDNAIKAQLPLKAFIESNFPRFQHFCRQKGRRVLLH